MNITNKQHTIEKRLCIGLITTATALFVLYIYFISASVVHVVMRTEAQQQMKQVGSEISLLEGRFIAAQHNVSSEIASLEGYTPTSKKVFIDRTAPSFALANSGAR